MASLQQQTSGRTQALRPYSSRLQDGRKHCVPTAADIETDASIASLQQQILGRKQTLRPYSSRHQDGRKHWRPYRSRHRDGRKHCVPTAADIGTDASIASLQQQTSGRTQALRPYSNKHREGRKHCVPTATAYCLLNNCLLNSAFLAFLTNKMVLVVAEKHVKGGKATVDSGDILLQIHFLFFRHFIV